MLSFRNSEEVVVTIGNKQEETKINKYDTEVFIFQCGALKGLD